MAKTTKRTKAEAYEASIKILGKVYLSKGKTVREALENLKPLGSIKGTSIIAIAKGENRKERILNTVQVSRLFSPSKITREISLKGISSLFDL